MPIVGKRVANIFSVVVVGGGEGIQVARGEYFNILQACSLYHMCYGRAKIKEDHLNSF